MTSAQQLMEQLQREGAARFADTRIAEDHSAVVRSVRRQRATRASVLAVAGVGVAGAAVFGISQYGPSTTTPATSPPPPSVSPSVAPAVVTLSVAKEQPIERVARALATAYGVTEDEAFGAITAALPEEAGGYPEGWVLAGEHTFGPGDGLESAAEQLVNMTVGHLEALGVPREQWRDTVILASIVQQEAPAAYADQTAATRVLLNRLEADMPLQIDSPSYYGLRLDPTTAGSVPMHSLETPYNTYTHGGLPPSAIGSFTVKALEAATDPADGDWFYFLRTKDGNLVLSRSLAEHEAAMLAEYPDKDYYINW